ncbi:IMPACT family protein [Georgenia muralis]|uniref:Putative YigZ family protein n=1 Tax=Georgenia muralis TaxID=154117 RepID=A0A3N4ZQD2_9MICO|nr:YigZ family protein [Georgenia muralis]RPF27752.1 putative YigZ family protein [Georgenia muralis]
MTDLRLVRGADVVVETEVRRSRFVAVLRRVDDEESARGLVSELRARHPGARHHCSAFVLDVPGTNPVERSNDDGEPPGTAGMPMLEALRASGVRDVVAVVVRYFGGVKLGTGGLVRAYGDAVRAALAAAPVVVVVSRELWQVVLPHAEAGRVEADLHDHDVGVEHVAYEPDGVRLTLAVADSVTLTTRLAALTAGTARPVLVGTTAVERPR